MAEIISVPTIMLIVYAVVETLKLVFTKNKEKLLQIVPLICLGLGVVLGVVAFFAAPSIIPSNNILSAILVGAVSGLSATGTNQIFKQFSKPHTTE